jgi:hypothetical protein
MKELNNIYEKYPTNVKDFAKWRELAKANVDEAKEKFRPRPL